MIEAPAQSHYWLWVSKKSVFDVERKKARVPWSVDDCYSSEQINALIEKVFKNVDESGYWCAI